MKAVFLMTMLISANAVAAADIISVTGDGSRTCIGNDDNFCFFDAKRTSTDAVFENADKACVDGYLTLSSPQVVVSERLPSSDGGVLSTAHVIVSVNVQCLVPGVAFEATGESKFYPHWSGNAGPDEARAVADQAASDRCTDGRGSLRVSTYQFRAQQKPGSRFLIQTIANAKYACIGRL